MDALPEEILDRIFSAIDTWEEPYLTQPDSRTPYSLGTTSRKFCRIAKPYLYRCIRITLGSAGAQLLRTPSADDDLAAKVEYFAVQHSDDGCDGFVAEAGIKKGSRYWGTTCDCVTIFDCTVHLLLIVAALGLAPFPLRNEWMQQNPEMPPQQGDESDYLSFNLRHLSVCLDEMDVGLVSQFLGLPSLRFLEADVRNYVDLDFKGGLKLRSIMPSMSAVEHLTCIGYSLENAGELAYLVNGCTAVRKLLVATQMLEDIDVVVDASASHIGSGTLKSIQVAIVGLGFYDVEVVPYAQRSANSMRWPIHCIRPQL